MKAAWALALLLGGAVSAAAADPVSPRRRCFAAECSRSVNWAARSGLTT